MRRLLIVFICCVCAFSKAHAAVHDNEDLVTLAAMRTSYEIQNKIERDITEALNVILKNSTKASLSAAGIYMSKLMERKALANAGRFGSQGENMYYRHIAFFVTHYLTPKVFSVAQLMVQSMVRSPHNIVYWGPYLYSVTEEIRQLLAEFQYVVCNGKITMTDLFAYVVSEELQDIFNLAKLLQIGFNVDFTTFFNNLVDLGDYTFNDLKDEMEGIAGDAAALATAGWGLVGDAMGTLNSTFEHKGKLNKKVKALEKFYKENEQRINDLNPMQLVDRVMDVIHTPDSAGVAKLLQRKTLNADEYASQYANKTDSDSYFTQEAHIYYVSEKNSRLADYNPVQHANESQIWARDNNHIFTTAEDAYDVCADFAEAIQDDNFTGYTGAFRELIDRIISSCPVNIANLKAEVEQFNRDNKDCKREITYSVVATWKETNFDKVAYFALGYSLNEYCNQKRELYYSQFDSYKMDVTLWKQMVEKQYESLKAQYADGTLDSAIDPETGLPHKPKAPGSWEIVLEYSDPKPYVRIDAGNASDIAMASFTANCHDSLTLFEGSTKRWVEKSANDKLVAKCKETAMKTEEQCKADGKQNAKDLYEDYQAAMRDLEARIATLDAQIKAAKNRLEELVRNPDYTMTDNDRQAEISKLTADITGMRSTMNDLESQLMDMRSQEAEMKAEADACVEEDSYKRIPYYKALLAQKFNLRWDNDGWWEGYTYKCTATIDSTLNGQAYRYWFTAKLRLVEKRQYWPFHIVKRHARVLADITLTANAPSSTALETVTFMDETAERRAAIINAKADHYRQQWPDCEIETEVMYRDSLANDSTGNPFHLLWITDRLRTARRIDLRLQDIYATLVTIEKWMQNEQSLLDFLKNEIVYRMSPVVRGGIYRDAVTRWRENARAASRSHNQKGNDNEPDTQHNGSALPPDGGPAMARRR